MGFCCILYWLQVRTSDSQHQSPICLPENRLLKGRVPMDVPRSHQSAKCKRIQKENGCLGWQIHPWAERIRQHLRRAWPRSQSTSMIHCHVWMMSLKEVSGGPTIRSHALNIFGLTNLEAQLAGRTSESQRSKRSLSGMNATIRVRSQHAKPALRMLSLRAKL